MPDPWGKPLADLATSELDALVRRHDHLYWDLNAPEISDYDYDRLVRRLTELDPRSPLLSRVGGGGEAARERLGSKVVHPVPMLSLDKAYTEAEVQAWAADFEGDVVGSPKIDGMAVAIRYDAEGNLALAATRGDGERGDDVTANVREIPGVPRRLPEGELEVRGEIYAPLSEFRSVAEQFANPRNFAAGTVKQKEGARANLARLRFFAYDLKGRDLPGERERRDLLARLGFTPVRGEIMPKAGMPAFYARVLAEREDLDFELDGVVFKAERAEEQERLGATAHHPRHAIAWKFQGESGTSTLLRIEWSVARTGAITPVAVLEPVKLSGATVTRCSLHNLNILRGLDLKLGDRVVAMRRGGVIPNIETSLGGGTEPVLPPAHCPACGRPTAERDGFLYCVEPTSCRASALARLEHFAKVVEIDGFGARIVDLLHERGLLVSPAHFYRLRADDLGEIERMGETLAAKLVRNVNSRRTLTLAVFLQALGLREVGRQVAQAIAAHVGSLDRLRASSEAEIGAIFGVGPVIAASVVQGLIDARASIDDLLTEVTVVAETAPAEGRLSGKKVVFTGKLQRFERKQAQALVRQHGGATPPQVTRDLDYLVVGDEGSPLFGQGTRGGKLTEADRINAAGGSIRIVAEGAFFAMLEGSATPSPTPVPGTPSPSKPPEQGSLF